MQDVEHKPSILKRQDGATIAYHKLEGTSPTVVFCSGYMSDMTGSKATALEEICKAKGQAFVRFDYFGHGQSSGDFTDGTISRWAEDARAVIDEVTEGDIVLVGSSMGGWIMLLTALARPERIKGLVGIAAAPDFTEDLMWQQFDDQIKEVLQTKGIFEQYTEYGDDPYRITMALIEDGRNNLLLRAPIVFDGPVRLLHGQADTDVPAHTSLRIAEKITSQDVEVILVKRGDHRLSDEVDINRLGYYVDQVSALVAS